MGVSNPARFGLCLATKQTNFPMRFIPSVLSFFFSPDDSPLLPTREARLQLTPTSKHKGVMGPK